MHERRARSGACLALALAVIGCRRETLAEQPFSREEAVSASAARTPARSRERMVVLVTIDGVRVRDVRDGSSLMPWGAPASLMPETEKLVRRDGTALGLGGDACGAVRPLGEANLSLPGYSEILGGRPTECIDNECSRARQLTVLDAAALDSSARGLGPVASIASWPRIARAASSGRAPVLVSAGRGSWPDRGARGGLLDAMIAAGDRAGPWPGQGRYRPDDRTAPIALEYLRTARPRFLHVGLGDTDEHAHANARASYAIALRLADVFVRDVATVIDEIGGAASVVVTTDHGRGPSFRNHGPDIPSSHRSFVLAFGEGIAHRGDLCEHGDATLPQVGATLRTLLSLPPDEASDAAQPIQELLAEPVSNEQASGASKEQGT